MIGKLEVVVNNGGHSIKFEFRMKGALATVEICVLCGRRLLNHFDIMLETPYSCNTVSCELK